MKPSKSEILWQCLLHVLLAAFLVTVLFPLFWMISGSFKSYNEILDIPPKLLPARISLDNFFELHEYFQVERFLLNSLIVSFATVTLQIVISIMAAFAFAKIDFKWKQPIFVVYLVTMMIPFQIYMVALLRIFVGLHLKDTMAAIILPGTFSAFSIFLARQHIRSIPDSYLEAGFLDGAGYLRLLFSVIVPLCKPVIATIAVLSFMSAWNQFIWPLIVIDSTEKMTLPLGMSRVNGMFRTEYNILMTGNLVLFLPTFLVYMFAQKHFIKSLAMTGVKG